MYRIDHREFGVIVRGIEWCLTLYPDHGSWRDLALVVDHQFAEP